MIDIGIFRIIVRKFSHKKKLYPIIFNVIDKSLEISLYCTILSLNLAINLEIESGKILLFDPKKVI